MNKARLLVILLISALIVSACSASGDEKSNNETGGNGSEDTAAGSGSEGQEENNSNGNSDNTAPEIDLTGVEPEGYTLSISGDVTDMDSFSDDSIAEPAQYEPLGGNDGNSYGTHELLLYTDADPSGIADRLADRDADAEAPATYELQLEFPHDISPGTYDLGEDTTVVAQVMQGTSFSPAIFDDNVSGSATFAEVGDALSVAFNFDAQLEPASGDTYSVTVEGRANQIPFDHRRILTAEITEPVDKSFTTETEADMYAASNIGPDDFYTDNIRFQVVLADAIAGDQGNENYLEIAFWANKGIEPGTYDVAPAIDGNGTRVPQGSSVAVNIFGFQHDPDRIDFDARENVSGTLTFEYDDRDRLTGSFELSGDDPESGQTLSVSGTFEYIAGNFR